ncbi:MAG: helix-turn-helix domain-containing protein [Treponema sp.]|uniref:helix-turn-helix domain-containing protein n=1 Tax=Treponema sp. TaxID=166 RepID=UPI0025F13589|nr:helix-turn-helix domain-containing protein [Treponema sp.]MBQ9282287.1 helix-turn-helix domain-containing protein [Treponema sp.]
MENPFENGGFITIQSWMVKKLGLKSNELIIYALIHGFSQDGRSYFYGSIKYIMENTNLSKETVLTVLQSLVKKKLIVKKDVKNYQSFDLKKNAQGSQHFCLYYTSMSRELNSAGQESVPAKEDENHGSRNLTRQVKNLDPHGSRNLTGTGQEFRPNNLLDNKFDTATSEKQEKENQPEKKKFGILKKSEEAEGVIRNELKELFGGHLVFDKEFIPEIARLTAQFGLERSEIPAYLRFAFERTSDKKPNSLTNMYYKMAKSPAVIQDFLLEQKKTKSESEKNTVFCPVCGARANIFGVCPCCEFDMALRNDEKTVILQRQIHELPENERKQLEAEYDAEIRRQHSLPLTFIERQSPEVRQNFRERIAEIYRKYGITA